MKFNAPFLIPLQLGSITADDIVGGFKAPRKMVILAAKLVNSGAIAQSDTDYVVVQVKVGSNVKASYSTQLTGGQGALADNVSVDMTLTKAAADGFRETACILASGDEVVVSYDETGTTGLTAAQVALYGYYL